MKELLSREFYGNTFQQWLITFIVIVFCFLAAKIVYWIFKNILKKKAEKTSTDLDNILIEIIEKPLVFMIIILGIDVSIKINLSENISNLVGKATRILLIFVLTWFIARFLDLLIKKYLKPIVEKTDTDMDDQLLPVFSKGIRTITWCMGIIIALDNIGYDIQAIIAGLGIGGIAFALAAQDTVSNFFGGITIFIDKPFKIGERIKINGIDGTVKDIGIRSSRIETLEGRIVTIQNSNFIKSPIENVTSEPSRKVIVNLGLVYDTSYEKMEEAIKTLKTIAVESGKLEEKVITAFSSFGDFSLNITFIYYIKKGEDIFGTQSEINFEILKRYNEKGLEFAYPTQTIYRK